MPIISGRGAFGADNFADQRQRVSAMDRAGVNVEGAKTAEDALKEAGMWGWNVQKVPMWADLTGYPGSPHRAWKDDATYKTVGMINGQVTPLGTVGSVYKPVQNEQHAEFLDQVVGQSGGHYKQVVSFKGGRVVYVAIELPEAVKVGGVDPVNMLLYGVNSHDGSTNFMLTLSPERLACANQLGYFRANSIKFRHSGEIKDKVMDAQRALGITFDLMRDFETQSGIMADVPMRADQYLATVQMLHPMPEAYNQPTSEGRRVTRKYDKVMGGLEDALMSPANRGIADNAWGGLQAYVEWAEWINGSDKGREERIMMSKDLEGKVGKARDAFMRFALAA